MFKLEGGLNSCLINVEKTAILLLGGFPHTSHLHTSVYCGRLQFYIVAKLYPHTDPMVAREPWFLSRSSCHRILNFVFAYFFPLEAYILVLKKTNIPLYQYTNVVVFASY